MRTLGRFMGLALVAAGALGCDQPPADCTTGHGGFAAKYTFKEGSKQGLGACDALKGEIIGIEKYNPSQAADPDLQDLTKARLRIRPAQLGDIAVAAGEAGVSIEGQELAALGDFVATTPDANNVCTVPTMSSAALQIPAGTPLDEADIEYSWKNVRIYVTTAYPGTQMVGDLTYREGGCTAEYTVVGLWPAIGCEKTDEMGNGLGLPDDVACDPLADPANGRATGSGINPDFKPNLTCDPNLLLCVLREAPPALR